MDLVRRRYQLAQNHYRSTEQDEEDRHA
jgi:hypothetical protein